MSETVHVTCDACGAPITTDRTRLDVRSGPLVKRGINHIDACPECLGRLTAALDVARPKGAARPAAD